MFKPMLACDFDADKLVYPVMASPKLDGVRGIVHDDGTVLSRSNKPLPNKELQRVFGTQTCCDGEFILGDPTAPDVYRKTVSCVMTADAPIDDLSFYVFDHIADPTQPWTDRITRAKWMPSVQIHEQKIIDSPTALLDYEAYCLEQGYEGLILRAAHGHYKYGRSTVREGLLLKVKRFCDAEAEVIGFEERMHNGNEATVNELGRTKRSSHKANKTGRGDLGALICRTPDGIEFNIGTGFTDDERLHIWQNRHLYRGRIAKYKFFPVGVKEAPRHPVFLGWRDPIDL